VLSGAIGSGQIGPNHLATETALAGLLSGSIVSGYVASGSLVWPMFGDAGVRSGNIASGNVSTSHLASGAVNSGQIGSGAVLGCNASGARNIASGTIGSFDLGSGVLLAASVGSGTIGTFNFASGATAPRAAYTTPFVSGFVSGTLWTIQTAEIISGGRGVAISQSGLLVVAMASVSGRMPAVGTVLQNVLSGIQAVVATVGAFQLSSGLADYSGSLGQTVYVGRSGQIVTLNTSWNSGGFLSGDVIQTLGNVLNSGAVLLNFEGVNTSGALTSLNGANVLSGTIDNFRLGSGSVVSGQVGSGAVQGSLGGGAFNLASGTIGPNELGSGSVQQSHIASGQIQQFHLALQIIASGYL